MNQVSKEKTIHTLFRILFSLIFVMSGVIHLLVPHKVAARLTHSPFAPHLSQFLSLETHVLMAGLILLAAGLALLLGLWTQKASLALLAVLIPITVTVQMGGAESIGPLFKNIALMGGLIYFAYFGTQGWSLDAILKNAKARASVGVVPIVLALFLTFGTAISRQNITLFQSAQAATATQKELKSEARSLAILVRESKHLQIAIMTAKKGLKGADGVSLSSAKIVVCGKPGVEALKIGSPIEKNLQEAQAAGIEVAACGLSLKEAKLTKEQLGKSIQVVENGLWEMIRLQSLGAISIEL